MVSTHPLKLSIPKRSSSCIVTGASLKPGAVYYSLVFETEEGCEREDYSSEYWQDTGRKRCDEVNGVYWKGQIPPKKPKPQTPEERDRHAVNVLKELMAEPDHAAQAFVLALYLRRRKKIALRREKRKEGQLFQLFELLGTQETLPIPVVDLSSFEEASVQRELAARLQPIPEVEG